MTAVLIDVMILQIGVALFFGMLLGSVFSKFRQSPIIGFILAGILLGPQVTGIVSQTGVLELFSELGVLLLLFYVGMELDTKKLRQGGFTSLILGPTKILICFALGFVPMLLLGFSNLEAILLGVVMAVSSTVIVGKYLVDNNLTKSLETSIAIPMLLIEDFAIIIVLALLSAYGSQSLTSIFITSIFFLVVAIHIIGEYSKKLIELIESFDYEKHLALYAVGIALAVAFLAKFFQMSSAIGAFLGGFLLSGVRHSEKIRHELETFRNFFSLFFFLAIGLSFTVPKTMNDFSIVLGISVLLVILCMIGKWLSYGLLGSIIGLDAEFGVYLANVMAPIGEFSLIVAGMAIALNLPNAAMIVNISIFVVAISTLIMPALIKWSSGIEKFLKTLLPWPLKALVYALRTQFSWFTHLATFDSTAQNEFLESLKKIVIYLIAMFGIVYLVLFTLSNTQTQFFSFISNERLLQITAVILMLPAIYIIKREIKKLATTFISLASQVMFKGLNEFQLSLMHGTIADTILGMLLIFLAFPTFFVANFFNKLYKLVPIALIAFGVLFILKGLVLTRKKHSELRKDIKKIETIRRMSSMKIS